ncbi:hypothetical protein ACLB2K_073829 [Fragaria x ananassa]
MMVAYTLDSFTFINGQAAIDCSYCHNQLKLLSIMKATRVRCPRCNTITRIAHPYYSFLGGAKPYAVPAKKHSDKKSNSGSSTIELASPSQPHKGDGTRNITVSGNHVSGNNGNHDGEFSVGNTIHKTVHINI